MQPVSNQEACPKLVDHAPLSEAPTLTSLHAKQIELQLNAPLTILSSNRETLGSINPWELIKDLEKLTGSPSIEIVGGLARWIILQDEGFCSCNLANSPLPPDFDIRIKVEQGANLYDCLNQVTALVAKKINRPFETVKRTGFCKFKVVNEPNCYAIATLGDRDGKHLEILFVKHLIRDHLFIHDNIAIQIAPKLSLARYSNSSLLSLTQKTLLVDNPETVDSFGFPMLISYLTRGFTLADVHVEKIFIQTLLKPSHFQTGLTDQIENLLSICLANHHKNDSLAHLFLYINTCLTLSKNLCPNDINEIFYKPVLPKDQPLLKFWNECKEKKVSFDSFFNVFMALSALQEGFSFNTVIHKGIPFVQVSFCNHTFLSPINVQHALKMLLSPQNLIGFEEISLPLTSSTSGVLLNWSECKEIIDAFNLSLHPLQKLLGEKYKSAMPSEFRLPEIVVAESPLPNTFPRLPPLVSTKQKKLRVKEAAPLPLKKSVIQPTQSHFSSLLSKTSLEEGQIAGVIQEIKDKIRKQDLSQDEKKAIGHALNLLQNSFPLIKVKDLLFDLHLVKVMDHETLASWILEGLKTIDEIKQRSLIIEALTHLLKITPHCNESIRFKMGLVILETLKRITTLSQSLPKTLAHPLEQEIPFLIESTIKHKMTQTFVDLMEQIHLYSIQCPKALTTLILSLLAEANPPIDSIQKHLKNHQIHEYEELKPLIEWHLGNNDGLKALDWIAKLDLNTHAEAIAAWLLNPACYDASIIERSYFFLDQLKNKINCRNQATLFFQKIDSLPSEFQTDFLISFYSELKTDIEKPKFNALRLNCINLSNSPKKILDLLLLDFEMNDLFVKCVEIGLTTIFQKGDYQTKSEAFTLWHETLSLLLLKLEQKQLYGTLWLLCLRGMRSFKLPKLFTLLETPDFILFFSKPAFKDTKEEVFFLLLESLALLIEDPKTQTASLHHLVLLRREFGQDLSLSKKEELDLKLLRLMASSGDVHLWVDGMLRLKNLIDFQFNRPQVITYNTLEEIGLDSPLFEPARNNQTDLGCFYKPQNEKVQNDKFCKKLMELISLFITESHSISLEVKLPLIIILLDSLNLHYLSTPQFIDLVCGLIEQGMLLHAGAICLSDKSVKHLGSKFYGLLNDKVIPSLLTTTSPHPACNMFYDPKKSDRDTNPVYLQTYVANKLLEQHKAHLSFKEDFIHKILTIDHTTEHSTAEELLDCLKRKTSIFTALPIKPPEFQNCLNPLFEQWVMLLTRYDSFDLFLKYAACLFVDILEPHSAIIKLIIPVDDDPIFTKFSSFYAIRYNREESKGKGQECFISLFSAMISYLCNCDIKNDHYREYLSQFINYNLKLLLADFQDRPKPIIELLEKMIFAKVAESDTVIQGHLERCTKLIEKAPALNLWSNFPAQMFIIIFYLEREAPLFHGKSAKWNRDQIYASIDKFLSQKTDYISFRTLRILRNLASGKLENEPQKVLHYYSKILDQLTNSKPRDTITIAFVFQLYFEGLLNEAASQETVYCNRPYALGTNHDSQTGIYARKLSEKLLFTMSQLIQSATDFSTSSKAYRAFLITYLHYLHYGLKKKAFLANSPEFYCMTRQILIPLIECMNHGEDIETLNELITTVLLMNGIDVPLWEEAKKLRIQLIQSWIELLKPRHIIHAKALLEQAIRQQVFEGNIEALKPLLALIKTH